MEQNAGKPLSTQFVPNFVTNIIFLIVNAAIGFILVRYYKDELGLVAYAVIPLATSVTSYVVLISGSLSTSISRYLSVSLQTSDHNDAQKTYNTAIFGILKIVLVLIPIAILIALMSPLLFNTDGTSNLSVQVLFTSILLSVLLTSWGNNFTTVLFSNNRIDYQNYVKILQVVLQVVLIVILFNVMEPNVASVGIAYLIAAIAYTAVGFLLARRTCPFLSVDRSAYDGQRFREICSIGGWTIVNAIGGLLFIQASIVLSNVLLGQETSAEFSIIAMIVGLVSTIGGTVTSLFIPVIYNNYSNKRIDNVVKICKSAEKIVGVFVAFPIAFICVFSPQFLTVWMGDGFAQLESPIWLMLPVVVIIESAVPLYTLGIAFKKNKIPGIATFAFGVVNVMLVILFSEFTDLGLVGLAVAWAIPTLIRGFVFNPWYYARVSGIRGYEYHTHLSFGVVCFIVSVLMCEAVESLLTVPNSLLFLIVLAALTFLIYLILASNLTFTKDEKKIIRSCLPSFIESRLPKWFL